MFADKIFAHLDSSMGDGGLGHPRCIAVSYVRLFGKFAVVTYDAVEQGKHQEWSMVFYLDVAVWILPVTTDGMVVLHEEYRCRLSRTTIMLCYGGGDTWFDGTLKEVQEETGCKLTKQSRVTHVDLLNQENGIVADYVNYCVVDGLIAPESHTQPGEGITGIKLVPFLEWVKQVRDGVYDDPSMYVFASRCYYNQLTRLVEVSGEKNIVVVR